MAISWVCWADLAIEQRVHRTCRARRAYFDTREAQLPRRDAQMLVKRGRSWRQRGRPQAVDLPQNLREQSSGDSNLCELERDVPPVTDDLITDLD